MQSILLVPPVAILILFGAVLILAFGLSRLSFRRKDLPAGYVKPYACGEDIPTHLIQPDYGQFFPFAYFFTILHVTALLLATVPAGAAASVAIAVVYVIGAIVGLSVLYRR